MNNQIKKITIIIFTTLFLNACVTGGKDVISSAKEKVFNSTNDDSNNVVHAGTSSGRSEFQGLNRINNTTTAVTTEISASDGLVAEQ